MGFSPDIIERHERRSEWICEPGVHEVTVTGWRYRKDRRARSVVFELQDDQDRRQEVSFSLSAPKLYMGFLRQFIGAAMGWDPRHNQGPSYGVSDARAFNDVVGKRVMISVVENKQGLHKVVGWGPVEPESTDE